MVVSIVTVVACGSCTLFDVRVDADGLGTCVSTGTSRGTNGVVGGDPEAAAAMVEFNILHAQLIGWPQPW